MSSEMSFRRMYRDPFYGRSNNWWSSGFDVPARIFDQNFGLGLCDDDLPTFCRGVRPRGSKETGFSEVKNDIEKFEVLLDVKQFTPEELNVKTVDKYIVIEGKHEERADEHGLITRNFCRKYLLPEDVRADSVNCSFSSDGVLTITAPRIRPQEDTKAERPVQIQVTGTPATARGTTGGSSPTKGKETNIPVNNEQTKTN